MAWASSPTQVTPVPSGRSSETMSACSAFVSWNSSTSTWSKRSRTRGPPAGSARSPRQTLFGRQAPGEGRVQHLAERELGIDAARVHVQARGLLREAGAAAAEAQGCAGDVHEILRVAPVEDREVGLHADVAGVDAEQPRGRRDAAARRGG